MHNTAGINCRYRIDFHPAISSRVIKKVNDKMKINRRIYLLGLCVTVIGGLALPSLFNPGSLQALSCPKCINSLTGTMKRVQSQCTGCELPGAAVYNMDCHACCHPTYGDTGGHVTAGEEEDCDDTRIYASYWYGTTFPCFWYCTTNPSAAGSCGSDNLTSPNCIAGEYIGKQAGTVCDPDTVPACS